MLQRVYFNVTIAVVKTRSWLIIFATILTLMT